MIAISSEQLEANVRVAQWQKSANSVRMRPCHADRSPGDRTGRSVNLPLKKNPLTDTPGRPQPTELQIHNAWSHA
jgi:hypothetical protein